MLEKKLDVIFCFFAISNPKIKVRLHVAIIIPKSRIRYFS